MPDHEFGEDNGEVFLRFERLRPGAWGEWSPNLRGPRGFAGSGGGGGGVTVTLSWSSQDW